MGFSLGRSIAFSLCAIVFLICSCDRHQPGEYPQVQRELADVFGQRLKAETKGEAKAEAAPAAATPNTPAAKPTPAEFFPTHPR